LRLAQRTQEDILLIVSMIFIAYGFWDRTRLILILGGVLCIFVILMMSGDNDRPKEDGTEKTP